MTDQEQTAGYERGYDPNEQITVRLTRSQANLAAKAIEAQVDHLNEKNRQERMKHPPMARLSHIARYLRHLAQSDSTAR